MSTVDYLVRLLYPLGLPEPTADGPPDLPLPADVRELLTRLGANGFAVDNRFHFTVSERLPENSRSHRDDLRWAHESDEITIVGDRISYRGGDGDYRVVFSDLLFVGSDDNGFDLYWEAVGDPDGWALLADGRGRWARHEMPTVDYLYGLLSGSLRCPVFTLRDWPEDDLEVVPT
ncbi:hypothetical protein [Nocardiopsis halotolerans]|uniref:hypothetical protein n=1 Tax=Nocardiopsis halotolerans TaxID=124252 RepID=UPI000346BFE8|nr:hypothetical protein [Nocardiopsis halotolerans]